MIFIEFKKSVRRAFAYEKCDEEAWKIQLLGSAVAV